MRRAIGIGIFAGAAALLVVAFLRTYERVTFDLDPALSVAAVLGVMIAIAANALVWRVLLRGSAVHLPSSEAVRIVALSQLGKYIPGGIWQPIGQVGLARRAGVGMAVATVTSGVFMVVVAVGALVVGPILLALSHAAGSFVWLLLLVAPAAAAVHPRVIRASLGVIARLTRRPMPTIPDVRLGVIAKAFGAMVPVWLLYGTSVWIGAAALGLADVSDWSLIAGTFAIAWVIGFLAIPVPGGLGVREGVMVLILRTKFPSADAVAIAVSSRLFFIAAEGLLAGVAAAIPRRPVTVQISDPA